MDDNWTIFSPGGATAFRETARRATRSTHRGVELRLGQSTWVQPLAMLLNVQLLSLALVLLAPLDPMADPAELTVQIVPPMDPEGAFWRVVLRGQIRPSRGWCSTIQTVITSSRSPFISKVCARLERGESLRAQRLAATSGVTRWAELPAC